MATEAGGLHRWSLHRRNRSRLHGPRWPAVAAARPPCTEKQDRLNFFFHLFFFLEKSLAAAALGWCWDTVSGPCRAMSDGRVVRGICAEAGRRGRGGWRAVVTRIEFWEEQQVECSAATGSGGVAAAAKRPSALGRRASAVRAGAGCCWIDPAPSLILPISCSLRPRRCWCCCRWRGLVAPRAPSPLPVHLISPPPAWPGSPCCANSSAAAHVT